MNPSSELISVAKKLSEDVNSSSTGSRRMKL
jgi:hypothetical protein